ncbi:MAG: helix-turn-helix domain-containing protein [Oscillospiraceae bacterium]|nr:helix-turn-helix domain-containing protein [Oscillospiraceae bacterium]
MSSDIKKSYYAVIPATVRYDNNIIPSAKLLYGEITALCNEKGYCWATNDYFSRLYSVSKRTISSWIKSLCDAGYISSTFVMDDNSKKVKIRCLKVEANFYTHLMKTSIPSRRKVLEPHEENFAENNTINNTMNNISLSQIFNATSTDAINEQIKEEKPSTICTTKNCDGGVKNKKIFSADSDPYLLALFLENNILKNNPKFPQSESGRQRWAKDFDLMIRRDKIDADDIAEVIEWCQKDKFWRSNILSGKKLRDKYQQLRMKMISW